MLLTITNTKSPATDLGYLLHKNPNRLQSSELSFGKAHVFYPEIGLVKVNARGTSQQCPCGAPVPKKLWDRLHQCAACGLKTTRDHASALEILRRGLRLRTETPALAGVALEAPSFSYGA
jgi:hypothetical protein